jgi:hypothetical protein
MTVYDFLGYNTPRSEDARVGAPDCYCGYSTMRHHGESRPTSGAGAPYWGDFTGCKDCTFCDYYKADLRMNR